jgi:hypothetical protein
MRIRSLVAALLFCTLVIFVTTVFAAPRDPAVDGRSEFLSATELQAALVVARKKLAPSGALASIYRVHVVSPTKIEAWYGDPNALTIECLILEHGRNGWRITGKGGVERG